MGTTPGARASADERVGREAAVVSPLTERRSTAASGQRQPPDSASTVWLQLVQSDDAAGRHVITGPELHCTNVRRLLQPELAGHIQPINCVLRLAHGHETAARA